ncbi:hypothetical protein HG536_0E00800 [Torulaspora globosa]|uniref:Spindle pole body component 110 n=1 Tax=Torulaspora globosa TaxID=48254 RepID=A0A7G3ZI33_9SACH|nr:uncharacterized protein HG536_0E00800 [Torulaspora globosa]QLL33169.1 hypothetical protein HG536_0E00800 [Torulaspora globosa]
MDETVNRPARDLKNFEFTPIGYVKEKQNGKRTNGPISDDDHGIPRRKTRKMSLDDSFNSTRMFNDESQLEETLPHVRQEKENTNVDKRNLMQELSENAVTSNPLREQQEKLHKLNTENYSLRLKCNSLLKFLNSVTDQGELKKSLGLLEEIQEWKQKFEKLQGEVLKLRDANEQLQLSVKAPQLATPPDTKEELERLKERYAKLEEDTRAKHEQNQIKIDMLKSDLNNLNVTLATKNNDLEEKERKIERLRTQLEEFDHRGSASLLELERSLDLKNDVIKRLEDDLAKLEKLAKDKDNDILEFKRIIKRKDDELSKQSVSQVRYTQQEKVIRDKTEEVRRLTERNRALDQSINQITVEHNKLERKVADFQHLKDELESQKKELALARTKLKEAEELSARFQSQIIENTTKNSEKTSQRVKEKELEINNLKDQLRRLRQSQETLLQKAKADDNYEIEKMEREILLLKEELKVIEESHQRELETWKSKCDSLNRENERIVHQEVGSIGAMKKNLDEKLSEIERLNKFLEQLRFEKSDLAEKAVQLQTSKDRYKEELKKIVSKFEHLSKEYIKLREKNETGGDDELSRSFREKYNSMKQRLLDELKVLQQENLALERKLMESKGKSVENGTSARRSNTMSQDRIDYYKLKYHTEVKQNDDLRTMNEYLNRVLRAISQHVRLDLMKIRNEVDPELPAYLAQRNQYPFAHNLAPLQRPKFKTIALFVQACVRMKQAALRHRWDQQRIRYLQRKMALEDDRVTW